MMASHLRSAGVKSPPISETSLAADTSRRLAASPTTFGHTHCEVVQTSLRGSARQRTRHAWALLKLAPGAQLSLEPSSSVSCHASKHLSSRLHRSTSTCQAAP